MSVELSVARSQDNRCLCDRLGKEGVNQSLLPGANAPQSDEVLVDFFDGFLAKPTAAHGITEPQETTGRLVRTFL